MTERRTLISGGAGFIDSHLVDHLLERGDRVLVVDDLSTGRLENLAAHADNPALTVITATVCDQERIETLVAGCDRVFHLAAGVGVRLLADQPARLLDENMRGTAAVLGACARHGKTAALVAPFKYSALLWATLIGFIVFGELPDRWTVVGAVLIVLAGLYVLHRETQLRRAREASARTG
jgi:nucleoside-diphosphate-sugar epimerase